MLKAPAEFPHPGSYAIHRRRRVRIIQNNKDGTLLVSAGFVHKNRQCSVSRRVRVEELKPAKAVTALHATANGAAWALAAIGAWNVVQALVS